MAEKGSVSIKINNGVGNILFHHPKANALPSHLLANLTNLIADAGKNPKIKIIVVKSSGKGAFCAGANFEELVHISTEKEGKRFFMGFAKLLNTMRRCPKLIVAKIQGKAVGGGVGLAACSDFALAHQSASIKLSELSIHIGPFVIEPAVKRKIGAAAFGVLAMDAERWYPAEWAEDRDLYARIFETQEQLDKEVTKLTTKLSAYSLSAMKELKTVLWSGTQHWDILLEERAALSGKLVISKSAQRAISSIFNN